MSTQFFERQDTQKRYTLWLVGGFIAAILLVVLVINLVIIIGVGGHPMQVLREEPSLVAWVTLIVFGTILLASWHRSSELRAGGAVVARALGGVQVNASDGDLQRQRLVNIVEEMAIAARIRTPQVFVLPKEAGINAFAAGHSPDEAAVAVTQGALDAFDRDQLQAVIGHEFSHILNGDMKINMRLTAWIFGLCVITDLARHFMNKRGGGKGAARVKLIAFGVFLAGSAGLFAGRLLQAAVSRRREHLADASAVQFTRNPQALQNAFIVMAASASGTRLEHEHATGVAHMFFAGSHPAWISKISGSWFATHPPLEERVRAIDARVTPLKFRTLVSDERRKIASRAATAAAAAAAESPSVEEAGAAQAPQDTLQFSPVAAMASPIGVSPLVSRGTAGGGTGPQHTLDDRCADGARRDDADGRSHDRGPRVAAGRAAQSPGAGSAGGHRNFRRTRGEVHDVGAGHLRRHHAVLRAGKVAHAADAPGAAARHRTIQGNPGADRRASRSWPRRRVCRC